MLGPIILCHVMIIHFGKDFWETLSHSFDIIILMASYSLMPIQLHSNNVIDSARKEITP